nr:AAA family ATPase [Pseudenhygromyxa sp. WMMC2535]
MIHAGSRSRILRARREDGTSVVLKTLDEDRRGTAALSRLRREWELASDIEHPNVIRYLGLELGEDYAALVMEDFSALTLAERIPPQGFAVERFLALAVQLARGLAAIHARGVVHKDVKPGNVLVDEALERVKYIDFGVSARLDEGGELTATTNRLEGTLAYISPEQTGRMKRSLDRRADLYSLGVTFYELLCGRVPFTASEALELVHCHLAKLPEAPRSLRPELPELLSRLIMRLLAKAPEDRYQSARSLLLDLQRCRESLAAHGSIEDFELGRHDHGAQLRVPLRLFGRERDLAALERAWAAAASGRASTVLVTGSSGVGKSALVGELEERLRGRPGVLISGKFGQLAGRAAYEGFAEAFRGLAGRILGAGLDDFAAWRARLSAALASNGRVVLDVVPEMEPIVGALPPLPAVGPEESQHRFNLVFRRFVRACASAEHPLTLFLDDLQWADPGSLALLENLACDADQGHLLLIGSVRADELDVEHPTRATIERLRERGVNMLELPLRGLALDEVEALIVETLGRPPERVRALAELVLERTGGNPLFVRTFLQSAWEEQLLVAEELALVEELPSLSWRWDEAGMRGMQASESVGELLARRIRQLPKAAQHTLSSAACVGASFTCETLAAINQTSAAATLVDLEAARHSGMLFFGRDERWDFAHDRVREAAHALLPERVRAVTHLRIGRMLLANTPSDRLNERVFAIVDHLDYGRTLIDAPEELVELARLASLAGSRAHGAAAYASAVRYLSIGVEALALLDRFEDTPGPTLRAAWRDHHELSSRLHRQLANAEFLIDDVESSRRRVAAALEHARGPAEQVALYDLLVFQQTMATRYAEALATGRRALALLDVHLPESEDGVDQAIARALAEYREGLAGRSVASLIELPSMTERETMALGRLLATMMSAALSADVHLFPLITLMLVNLSLTHGLLPESSYGFAHHGTFVGAVLGDHVSAHEWGKLALALARKQGDLGQECRVCDIVAGYILPWRIHVRECDSLHEHGLRAGIESGQLQFVGYIRYHRQLHELFSGAPLPRMAGQLADARAELERINHVYAANVVRGLQLVVANLLDEPGGDDEALAVQSREFQVASRQAQSYIALCVHQIYLAQARYIHGDPLAALEAINASKEFAPYALGHVALADRNLYHSLALISAMGGFGEERRRLALVTIEHNQDQLRLWARSCPENFEHKYLLVAAELARWDDDLLGALDLYDRAIEAAAEQGFVQVYAIANERAARMWFAHGKRKLARPYLAAALTSYRSWGAPRRARQLEAEFPELLRDLPFSERARAAFVSSEMWIGSGSSQALDLATVTRASQAISSEIDLDRLLARMMRIILLNAGASRGLLILQAEDGLRVEVAADSEDSINLHQRYPLDEAELALSIVRHVLSTGENVVLEDAAELGAFTGDPHVLRRRLRSVLCTPIRHKDELVGVLYLENELTAGAFTGARTEVLQILLSQAAISLENARYYDELKALNEELRARADELAESKSQLEAEIAERERSQAERIELEAQLRQSQKMEAIGQLAGGVAHDFNNLLTTIIGSTDVLTSRARKFRIEAPELDAAMVLVDRSSEEVRVIREAAERGAALTRQLLAFSRRQVLQPELVDLNDLVARSGKILERLLGAEYELHIELALDLGRVRVDPGQLEQVVLNLVINARDASEPGRPILVSTREEQLRHARPAQPQTLLPGRYVVLEVSDEGSGMDEHTVAHIFEPFFTTKGVGKGTGLGLSTVLGIVQQSDGQITVDSEPGEGTRFAVWLPWAEGSSQVAPAPEPEEVEPSLAQGKETVLVVEDEAPVRRTVEQILRLHGYEVLVAEDGEACLELIAGYDGTIDLVLTDFVMPRLGGLDLAHRLREIRPQTKILFMSGFTDGQLDQAKVAALGGIDLIEKPFRAMQLLERVRGMLESS